MVATELITGMEDIVQHIKDLEIKNKKLEEEMSAMKEALAEKFYKHYDDMGYNKLNIARTVGPNLGRMIEHLINENKKLQEKNQELQEERDEVWDELEKTKEEDEELKHQYNLAMSVIEDEEEENKKLKEEVKVLNKYREEMAGIDEITGDEVEDIVDVKDYIKKLQEELDNEESAEGLDLVQIKKLQEENKKLKEEIRHLEDRAVANYDTRMKENKKQLQKMKELEMKSNAKSDIIKNMFECITADPEEVQDGFYIKRDWGHKYIDTWNEIVTQEYKDALKEINEQLEGIEWETDGFQFDLNIVEEDSESEDE